jgi:nitrogen regulatory protein PII
MKYVVVIIQPHKLDVVREALGEIGIAGMTVSDVQGYGRQKGHTETYRGAEYKLMFVRKVKLEIACSDELAGTVVQAITKHARSGSEGNIGDGKIFVLDLNDAVRIRTGESGEAAL